MRKNFFQKSLISKIAESLTRCERTCGEIELFQNSVVEEVWDRTRGKCMICGKNLTWKNRDKRGSKGAWKIGTIINPSSKGYVLSNCEIDCLECYELTREKTTVTC